MCKISAREKCFWWKIGRLLFIINKWANCITLNNSNKRQKSNLQMNSKTACRGFKSFCPCQKTVTERWPFFFYIWRTWRTSGTEQQSGGLLWPRATKRPQTRESSPSAPATNKSWNRWYIRVSGLFLILFLKSGYFSKLASLLQNIAVFRGLCAPLCAPFLKAQYTRKSRQQKGFPQLLSGFLIFMII